MAQCSRREYCIDDIHNKLLLWGIGNYETDKILDILIKENFINELRYASAFVMDKFNYNKWGKVKIASHLKSKKIPPDYIQKSLDLIDNETYKKILKELVANHKNKVKAKNQYELKAKLLRYGQSKGYESSILYDLLNEPEE
jgi:regulatory protein